MSDYYKLVNKRPVPVDDVKEWAKSYSDDRHIGNDKFIVDGTEITVSTVFLALDHNFGGTEPILFETMIFGGKHNDYQERYTTWEEADDKHWLIVNQLKAGIFEG